MGQTPTSSDRFARPAAPGAKGIAVPGGRPDKFREKAERAGGKKPVAKLDQPKTKPLTYDAFAAQKRPGATRQDPFARHKPQPRVAGFVPAVAAPALAETEVRRAPLHVVAAQPVVAKAAAQPAELKLEHAKREEVRRTRMGKSSSLVLVTGAAAELAEVDAPPRPAPATGDVPPVAPAAPAPAAALPPLDMPAPKPRSGGGGGGDDGGKTAAPVRGRSFTQDDLVGIVFGLAVLALLWLMRGQQETVADDDGLVGTQFAATEPAAALAPPPAPLVDPFGDVAVDLKPTGPIPDAVEDPNVAVAEAAPPPAPVTVAPAVAAPAPAPAKVAIPPVAVADRTMHAWFCTSSSGMTTASQASLVKEMATFKSAFAGRELVVRGYADTRGTSVFNSALGGERANVVADFLRTNGLTVVDARGIGELDGLDDNQNCANQRRVDVYIKGGPGETPSRTCAPEPEVEELVCG